MCHDFRWLGLAKFGAAIRYFHRHDVTEVMMAGKIFKVRLFQRWSWVRHLPDLRTIRMFLPHFWTRKKDCRDDYAADGDCRRVRRRGDSFRPGHRLRAGVARERRTVDPPRPDGLAAKRHRVRLEDGQGDGPARHRPERGRQGPGRAGGRGRRGDRRVHPPRRRAVPARAASPW